MRNERRNSGFTLIEVLVSLVVLATAAAGTGAMISMAVASTRAARVQTWTTLLAVGKLEELRALSATATGLALSPQGSLTRDAAGYVDYVDRTGRAIDVDGPSPQSVYIRRWSIHALPADPAETALVQVLVSPVAAARAGDPDREPARVPGDALMVSVIARRRSAE